MYIVAKVETQLSWAYFRAGFLYANIFLFMETQAYLINLLRKLLVTPTIEAAIWDLDAF